MTKLTEEELKNMKHKELLERYKKLQELYFAPKKNSKNSSKPSSTDDETIKIKKNQSLREKSGKSSGGQKGHKGSTREHQEPNEIVVYNKDHCESCNANLSENIRTTVEKRQEIDIPPILPYIIQHERQETKCSCGCKVSGEFPPNIKGYTQFGPNVVSTVTYLNIRHKLPYQRLKEVIRDLTGLKISEGSIENTLKNMGEKAEQKCKEIMEGLQSSSYVGTDETGNHVNGEKGWVWTWQNDLFVYLCLEMSRGYKVVEKHFGETYQGVLGHDCRSAHNNTVANAHQLCFAHLHRDLNYAVEKDKSSRSYLLRSLLLKAQKAKKLWVSGKIPNEIWVKVKIYYEAMLTRLCQRIDSPYKDTMRLIKRIRKHKDKLWTFLEHKEIPAHNNSSEQVIRNQKIHKKISGGFRCLEGGQRHCYILSVIETSRRHGLDVLESLRLLYAGNLVWVRPE